jgi:hypothetical protein
MKSIMLINIFSIILGVAALSYKGINYSNRQKTMDIGPFKLPRKPERLS